MVAKLRAIKAELRLRMHEPVADVGASLRKVVTGYYRYHAVPGNIDKLSVFGQRLRRLWSLILRRRSQRPTPWDRLIPIYSRWLPAPRVLHPYPTARFLAAQCEVRSVMIVPTASMWIIFDCAVMQAKSLKAAK
jgi:RNA-directed DNA polymerase